MRMRLSFVREDYYADYYEFENHNWWFVSRRRILAALLRKYWPRKNGPIRILDAGCGTGINLEFLTEFGTVTGVDSSDEAIRFCSLRNSKDARRADITALPFAADSFDLVTALDVLEHIENDVQALDELARVCRPGGWLLITVPVFPSLWGEHDEINQHVRRYIPRHMLDLLHRSGFEIRHKSFMNTWLFPVALFWRSWRRLRRKFIQEHTLARADNMHHHPWMNRILTGIFSSELPFVLGPGLPFGLSLVVLAEKK